MSPKLKKLLKRAAKAQYLPLPSSGRQPLNDPLDLVVAFAEAWDDNDADVIGDLFVEDADFINVVGLWWTSRHAIVKAHRYGFRHMFADAALTLSEIRQRNLGDSVAVVTTRWSLTGQVDPDGKPTDPRQGILSATVVRLDDGTWIGVHCQNTDVALSADTNIARGDQLIPTCYITGPDPALVAASELVDD